MSTIFRALCWGVSVVLIAGGVASAALAGLKPNGSRLAIEAIGITAVPVRHFHKDGQSRARVGKLLWRGGLVLNSAVRNFGGYSGIEVGAEGDNFIAVSDAGTWLSGRLRYDNSRLIGIQNARIGPLLALGRRRLVLRRDRDAEAIRLLEGTIERGLALVAFERNQRIGTFRIMGGKLLEPQSYLRPPLRLPSNKGLEAVTVLKGGRYRGAVVAFAERYLDSNGHHRGWMWQRGRRQAQPIALKVLDGFDVTDVASLPDGSLVMLERRYRWLEGIKFRLRLVRAQGIGPGKVLSGITLVRADMRYEIDNMEGLAIHTDQQGRVILTLISDNNFNSLLQRTVLLQFELPEKFLARAR